MVRPQFYFRIRDWQTDAGYLDFVGNGRDYERISGRAGRKKKDE